MFQFTHPGRGATWFTFRGVSIVAVSIHAPREGCDKDLSPAVIGALSFNSRTPGGVRRYDEKQQSVIIDVSIHAPREGCDIALTPSACSLISFNSRTPGGVRPRLSAEYGDALEFQFTHPGRGATALIITFLSIDDVSIHAPREGCDKGQRQGQSTPGSFNSRTPGGVRLTTLAEEPRSQSFQFTHPGRGATGGWLPADALPQVSIHAPREGCD